MNVGIARHVQDKSKNQADPFRQMPIALLTDGKIGFSRSLAQQKTVALRRSMRTRRVWVAGQSMIEAKGFHAHDGTVFGTAGGDQDWDYYEAYLRPWRCERGI
jgi:hypothetical protein